MTHIQDDVYSEQTYIPVIHLSVGVISTLIKCLIVRIRRHVFDSSTSRPLNYLSGGGLTHFGSCLPAAFTTLCWIRFSQSDCQWWKTKATCNNQVIFQITSVRPLITLRRVSHHYVISHHLCFFLQSAWSTVIQSTSVGRVPVFFATRQQRFVKPRLRRWSNLYAILVCKYLCKCM